MDPSSVNYTPLNTEKLGKSKKSFKLSNKVLIALILFFTAGVGTVGFLLTQQKLTTGVPAQIDQTVSVTPVPSPTSEVSLSQAPATPSGEISPTETVELAALSQPSEAPTEEPTQAPTETPTEEPTPTTESGIGGASIDEPTATPTEIILAQESSETGSEEPTAVPEQPSEVPAAGVATYGLIFGAFAVGIILLGLIF